tara:strand:- start:30619 stop:31677 length:1059 start_codon:yes stop_codon:yes gene_type:complete
MLFIVKRNIRFKPFYSKRKPPKNLKKEDEFLFEHEFERKFIAPKLLLRKNVYVHRTSIRRFKYFSVHSKHWRMNNYLIRYKVKFFYKELLSFIHKEEKNTKVKIIEKASWVIDQKSYKYMHWFSDALQRIEQISQHLNEYPIIIEDRYKDYNYIIETLEILDIPYIVCNRLEMYKINELLISSHVAIAGNYKEEVISSVANKIKKPAYEDKQITNEPINKIWITRQNASIRKIQNFNEIENIIKKFNYQIVALEKYSLEEQIKLLYEAKVVAGLQGAGLNNILFMVEGGKVLEIRDKNDKKNNCYFSLSSALKIDFFYCKSKTIEPGNFHTSDHILDPLELEKSFKEIEECL